MDLVIVCKLYIKIIYNSENIYESCNSLQTLYIKKTPVTQKSFMDLKIVFNSIKNPATQKKIINLVMVFKLFIIK